MEKNKKLPLILAAVALLVAIVIIIILAMSGCEARNELERLKKEFAQLQNATPPEADVSIAVFAQNATIGGKNTAVSDGKTALTANAVLSEGQTVDHWEVNGVAQENSATDTFTFTATEATVVKAVLAQEKKVTTINCAIRFLDAKGKAAGDKLSEFVFDKPYKNPVTQADVTDGTISFQVKAEVPSDKVIDYWKINGVEYHITNSSFTVIGLDESTEYEVVLKEKPAVYYTVLCEGCKIDGKTEVKVKAGTKVTAKTDYKYAGTWWLDGERISERDTYIHEWTITVDKDCMISFYATIN